METFAVHRDSHSILQRIKALFQLRSGLEKAGVFGYVIA